MSPTGLEQSAAQASEGRGWILLPREHGAWGMLLLPFFAGVVLGGRMDATVTASLAALLLGFVVREPLAVLARQRWVWKVSRPETETAVRTLAWQVPALGACGIYLLMTLPQEPLLLLGGVAAVLTAIAVWMIVHNRARSVALQVVSAVGLCGSALLAALATTGGLPVWAFQLWLLMSLNSVSGILLVHARLEHRIAKGAGQQGGAVRMSMVAAGGLAVGAAATWLLGYEAYPLPLALSALVAAFELLRLKRVGDEPFTRVGVRMLLLSIAYTAVVVVVLRSLGHQGAPPV